MVASPRFYIVPRRGSELGTIFLVCCAALAVYIPGIWWGLPHATNPILIHGWDVDSVSGMVVLAEFHNLLVQAKSDWYVAYPLFHYLVLGALYAPYLAYLGGTGALANPSAEYPYGFADPIGSIAALALIARIVSVAMAAGVIASVYLTAKTIWDRSTGLLAAVTALLVVPMFYYARTGNLDIPVLFWSGLAVFVLTVSFKSGLTTRRALALGALIALAVATKDQAYAPFAIGVMLLLVYHIRDALQRRSVGIAWWKPLVVLLLSGAVVYVLAGGIAVSPRRFLLHLNYLVDFRNHFPLFPRPDGELLSGIGGAILLPRTLAGYLTLLREVGESFWHALGPVVLGLGFIGIAVSWRTTRITFVLAAMGLVSILMLVFPIMHMQLRYVLFTTLVLSLFAGRALALGLRGPRFVKGLALLAAVVGLGWLAAHDFDMTYQMLFDARLSAAQYLSQALRPGDRVGYFGGLDQLPKFPPGVAPVLLPNDEFALDALKEKKVRFVLISPDAFSEVGMDHSWLAPEQVCLKLKDGSVGYQRLALFQTVSPLRQSVKYLPVINPPVQVFGLPDDPFAKIVPCCEK